MPWYSPETGPFVTVEVPSSCRAERHEEADHDVVVHRLSFSLSMDYDAQLEH